jgi:hypothetical protein
MAIAANSISVPPQSQNRISTKGRNQMKTMQFSKGMICTCFLMLGITLNAQTQDSVRGWGRALLAQPHQQNAGPTTATTPLDQGKASPPTSILGAWHLTGTFMGTPFETVMTFLPGDGNDQGAVTFTSNQDGPPITGTAGQGNWTRVGTYSFIATHLTFLFEVADSMPFVGVLKIVDAITLKGDQINVKSQIIFPAACGCGPFDVETTGSRVPIEAPRGH